MVKSHDHLMGLIWSLKHGHSVADPEFHVHGGVDLVGGAPTPEAVTF